MLLSGLICKMKTLPGSPGETSQLQIELLLHVELDIGGGRLGTFIKNDEVAEHPGIKFEFVLDLDDFERIKFKEEIDIETGFAAIDFVGELFTSHRDGFAHDTAERGDQFSKFGAEAGAVIIRFADVQNENCFVFFQNKLAFFMEI